MKNSKIEIWRVVQDCGAFYTLKNIEGETQDFMKISVPGGKLVVNQKVAITVAHGVRNIVMSVSENVTREEAENLMKYL